MVHPDFQQKGFGTVLTHHCNAIMDKPGDRMFVAARPTSIKMFKGCGFRVLGFHDSHLERLGGSRELSQTALLVREPALS
jgi:ribosomal protein S18 acetylase RimI-like enzyme